MRTMTGPSFFTQALRWFVAPKQHCLRWGVAASLCVHAALLVVDARRQASRRSSHE